MLPKSKRSILAHDYERIEAGGEQEKRWRHNLEAKKPDGRAEIAIHVTHDEEGHAHVDVRYAEDRHEGEEYLQQPHLP